MKKWFKKKDSEREPLVPKEKKEDEKKKDGDYEGFGRSKDTESEQYGKRIIFLGIRRKLLN